MKQPQNHTQNHTLETARAFFADDIYATRTTGIQITEVAPGFAKCTLNITPAHLNAAGSVMGGALYTLADFTFAVAANFQRTLPVTVTSQISFLSPAKGNILTATARCLKEGHSAVFFLIDIEDELGTAVACVSCSGMRVGT